MNEFSRALRALRCLATAAAIAWGSTGWQTASAAPTASAIGPVPAGVQTLFTSSPSGSSGAPPGELNLQRASLRPVKYLRVEPYGVHIMGTAGVSDRMMLRTYDLIEHMLGAMRDPEHRRRFAGHQVFVVTDSDPDIRALTNSGARAGHRNTGTSRYSMFNEALVCTRAVDTIRPDAAPEYRAFDTPVHEFGHAIEAVLGLGSQVDALFSVRQPNYRPAIAREYFSFSTQHRFDSPPSRDVPAFETEFIARVFSPEDTWRPSCDR